jgi:hypothetical protein
MQNLDDDTALIYAIKAYDKLNYVKSEYTEDVKVFRYLGRLFMRYREYGELRENLILNHINMVYNLFGVEAGTRLLFFKTNEKYYSELKTFLVFLNLMPEIVYGIRGKDIRSSDIPIDMNIANVLRNI